MAGHGQTRGRDRRRMKQLGPYTRVQIDAKCDDCGELTRFMLSQRLMCLLRREPLVCPRCAGAKRVLAHGQSNSHGA